jgi:metalloendopeptidase OMA1, mitochondrial
VCLCDAVRGWATDPYPEPLRVPVIRHGFILLLFHFVYWVTLPLATCLWLVYNYTEEVRDFVPFTGRPRINAINPEWIMTVAEATTKGVVADHGYDYVPDDDPRNLLVQRIFARILMASGLEDKLDWSIVLLDANMPHVYGNPNGQLILCAGMLPVALTEDGIAHLLSHEIAHIILGHHVETWGNQQFWPTVLRALTKMPAVDHESFIWRYAARRNSESMHSWLSESEADELGMQLMARACFSPSIVPALSDRLYRLSAERGPYFDVHPVHDSKQEELQKYLKWALDIRQKCNCPPERVYRVTGSS